MLGSLILYLKGMRIMMFQLSGFHYKGSFKGSFHGCFKGSLYCVCGFFYVFGVFRDSISWVLGCTVQLMV